MKCNYRNMATSDPEAMARKRTDELVAIRQELERRKGVKKPSVEVNFEKYVND